jgi:hypothetical protein
MLQGDLTTVPLATLLAWLGESGKSGCLLVQQGKRSTRLFLRDGRIVACSSDDPVKLLGQFLLFKRVIDETSLSRALGLQEEMGGTLRNILMEMGALTREQLAAEIVEKAEETILDLFEWNEASFWFGENIPVDENAMEVSLGIDEVTLGGTRRLDERERIRAIFHDPSMVLEKMEREPDLREVEPCTRKLYAAVDGSRTIEELILLVRGTEYQVTRRLAKLYEDGLLRVRRPDQSEGEQRETGAGPWSDAERPVVSPEQLKAPSSRIPEVASLLRGGSYQAALTVLEETHRARPGDAWLREEIKEVETAFVEKSFREDFAPSDVPVLARSLGSMSESDLSPTEVFLVGLMGDGSWDVKSLLWISPMRSVDVLLALRHLVELGLVTVTPRDESLPASA